MTSKLGPATNWEGKLESNSDELAAGMELDFPEVLSILELVKSASLLNQGLNLISVDLNI